MNSADESAPICWKLPCVSLICLKLACVCFIYELSRCICFDLLKSARDYSVSPRQGGVLICARDVSSPPSVSQSETRPVLALQVPPREFFMLLLPAPTPWSPQHSLSHHNARPFIVRPSVCLKELPFRFLLRSSVLFAIKHKIKSRFDSQYIFRRESVTRESRSSP